MNYAAPPPVRWLHGSAAASPIFRMDDAGRRAAERHIKQGDHGRLVCEISRSLPDWHLAAIEKREKRERSWAREVPAWATVNLIDAPTAKPESFNVRTHSPLPMRVAKVTA